MSEFDIDKLDVAVPPNDYDLAMVGSTLMEKIRGAIARDRLLGYEPENTWALEVEGSNAFVDDKGRTLDPIIKVGVIEPKDEKLRPVLVMGTRGGDPASNPDAKVEADIYRIDFFKNTELVAGLSKAVIGQDFIEGLYEDFTDEASESFVASNSDIEVIRGLSRAVEKRIKRFSDELHSQLEFGACTQSETLRLLNILQQSKPATDELEFEF